MKRTKTLLSLCLVVMAMATAAQAQTGGKKSPVDYVNPYIGNISHLLVPTFPTVQLPNSLLRVYPERADYTSELLNGLPIIVTNHRERSAFNLSATQTGELKPVVACNYDNERLTPYSFSVDLADNSIHADYALSHQSAIYRIAFDGGKARHIIINTRAGEIAVSGNAITAYQNIDNRTRVYLYIETEQQPRKAGIVANGSIDGNASHASGQNVCAAWEFDEATPTVCLRYGVSLISSEQARNNLRREIADYDISRLAATGRDLWNATLSRIEAEGACDDDLTVLYTSYYRTFERPVCISEDGRYYSAFDGKIHSDDGTPFYTDDWLWDTYRAAHPLRALIEPQKEEQIIASFFRMAEQMGNHWMPTFPEITGDTRRMNSNHGVAVVADALYKGLRVDAAKGLDYCRRGIEEKTLAPWSSQKAGWIDRFFQQKGYIPALKEGEKETDPNVHPFEKRQPVAVTLGTSYDYWCLSRIASFVGGHESEAEAYFSKSLSYRNLYNPTTQFFHPKDSAGQWIEPFDYRYSGGMGAREFYGENNGWVYRWDVPHNVADLISLMGGAEAFAANLDATFAEPLGKSKYEFYSKLPDHTGNVGQFSMANEPSLHVPYLYNYAGKPWKTQKRIRQMLRTWFRNDLMGMPGDEDGGGMTSFVVFSSLGFYPVTPGMPVYNIGSPLFTHARITLANGRAVEIVAPQASPENKYIQSLTINGEPWNKPWFTHDDIKDGATLDFVMGSKPNKQWGSDPTAAPPSALR